MCGLILLVIGAAMYSFTSYKISSSIDDGLRSTAVQINQQMAARRPLLPPSPSLSSRSSQRKLASILCDGAVSNVQAYCLYAQNVVRGALDTSVPGQYEVIRIFLPATLWLSPTQAPHPVIVTPGSQKDLAESIEPPYFFCGAASCFETTTKRSATYRIYDTSLTLPPILTKEGASALLAVFQNERTYLDIGNLFVVTLIIGVPLGLVIALLAGWWIARAALRPIGRISRTVRTIGESRDLSRRVDFVGPEDEVGRLASTFDGMMDRLERVFEGQKRFIADASHELRTPLTAIRGNADLMRIAPPEERDECLAAIRKEAERMSRLVTDLLLLAEADVAEHPIDRRPLQLDDLIADVYRSGLLVSSGKVDLVLEENEPLLVQGDGDRLKQVFLNLVDNAVKFTPPGGTVSISAQAEENSAVVRVSDSGVGIPPEEQEAIFERFYRVEEARPKRGSGLGLAISAWIVQAHGGTISVSSRPGKGSTFTVKIPLG